MEGSARNGGSDVKRVLLNKWHWTHEEDQLLISLVEKFGPRNWNCIAKFVEGRSGQSCRFRWVNQLNPKVDKTLFTEEELERLFDLHRRHGNKWTKLMSYFPGRTDNQLKNKYNVLLRKTKGQLLKQKFEQKHRRLVPIAPSGSNLSAVSRQENNSNVVAPLFGNFSSNGGDLGSIYAANTRATYGDSMASDARSAALLESQPLDQSEQGDRSNGCQFIDFMGVGENREQL